ncbi:MAG: hypothetical protein K2K56_08470 [Lachnospiraceae bacterium]|nr:hypothetical protein [Lachnospiraceae bacterium]
MKQSVETKNTAFVNKVIKKYEREKTNRYYHSSLIYRKPQKHFGDTIINENVNRFFTREFFTHIKRYEAAYYRNVTSQDNRKLIQTIEQIYNQPGEKKQLIHVFNKLGVVTESREVWQETRQTMKLYEEELTQLKRRLQYQEENYLQMHREEERSVSAKDIVREVMENIRREIRMERLRYGLDE